MCSGLALFRFYFAELKFVTNSQRDSSRRGGKTPIFRPVEFAEEPYLV